MARHRLLKIAPLAPGERRRVSADLGHEEYNALLAIALSTDTDFAALVRSAIGEFIRSSSKYSEIQYTIDLTST